MKWYYVPRNKDKVGTENGKDPGVRVLVEGAREGPAEEGALELRLKGSGGVSHAGSGVPMHPCLLSA